VRIQPEGLLYGAERGLLATAECFVALKNNRFDELVPAKSVVFL